MMVDGRQVTGALFFLYYFLPCFEERFLYWPVTGYLPQRLAVAQAFVALFRQSLIKLCAFRFPGYHFIAHLFDDFAGIPYH